MTVNNFTPELEVEIENAPDQPNKTEPEGESFHTFFDSWLSEQNQDLHELFIASKQQRFDGSHDDDHDDDDHVLLSSLVERVLKHYEHYYEAKSRWAKQDVLAMLSPSWISSLEDAFLWIGGWRPSMAFHLLYSKSGMQLEARFAEMIQGLTAGDLGDLSNSQIAKVDQLQRRTIKEEKLITEKMAKLQESMADTTMIELSQVVTELMRNSDHEGVDDHEKQIESTLASKAEGLEEILQRADNLRLRTLKSITLNILSPSQAVHFLISAAELHLRIHDWGKKKDSSSN